MNKDSIYTWAREAKREINQNGLRGTKSALKPVYKKVLHQTLPLSGGESIYNQDWDLLIVIDACRLDLLMAVANEYEFLESIQEFRSLESATRHWMRENFDRSVEEEMNGTAYICGNPFSEKELQEADFHHLEEVWQNDWDVGLGTLPPRAITDRVIELLRNNDPDRTIAHYMQPHCPFIANGEPLSRKNVDQWGQQKNDIWHQLERGSTTKERVWREYKDNVRCVLDDISILLNNIDAESVVLTSDHGNALGEWGLYGHPAHMPFDCLRVVPWVETGARDNGTHVPAERTNRTIDVSTEERLESLGYV